jgi:hypothetical protein
MAPMLWAVTQRQETAARPMYFGAVRVFLDEESAREEAIKEDGDSGEDLPLWELELEGAGGPPGELSELWLCGVWYEEDTACLAILPRAFRTARDARAAAKGFCPPASLGLNLASIQALREEGLLDPDCLELQIVRVSAEGQAAGELYGEASEEE